jgi:hypothetical protein
MAEAERYIDAGGELEKCNVESLRADPKTKKECTHD